MTDTPADLEALAVSVRKSLHWAVFLLAAMLVVLAIDLQIKRSIGRQAIMVGNMLAQSATLNYQTDRLIADVKEGTSVGQSASPPGYDADHAGRDGGDHVDGSPRVAARDGKGRGESKNPAPRRRASTPQRPPGDG